jgi:hypothetical protein
MPCPYPLRTHRSVCTIGLAHPRRRWAAGKMPAPQQNQGGSRTRPYLNQYHSPFAIRAERWASTNAPANQTDQTNRTDREPAAIAHLASQHSRFAVFFHSRFAIRHSPSFPLAIRNSLALRCSRQGAARLRGYRFVPVATWAGLGPAPTSTSTIHHSLFAIRYSPSLAIRYSPFAVFLRSLHGEHIELAQSSR